MFLVSPYSFPPGTMLSALQRLGLTTNLKVCLDAGDIDSYSGSGQTWTDVSENSQNFTNGENGSDTTGDFTFTGTSGRQSSSEYFAGLTSGCLFQSPLPTWAKAVHKSGGAITIVTYSYSGSDSYAGSTVSSYLQPTATNAATYPGFSFGAGNGSGGSTLGHLGFFAARNDGTTAALVQSSGTIPSSAWAFTACSIDATNGTYVLQINGTQDTGSISYSSPSSSDPSQPLTIRKGLSGALAHRINSIAMWSSALSAANLTALYNATKGKFGL